MDNAKLVENIKDKIKHLKIPGSAVGVFHEDKTLPPDWEFQPIIRPD